MGVMRRLRYEEESVVFQSLFPDYSHGYKILLTPSENTTFYTK